MNLAAKKDYSTSTDDKMRWGGFLEIPLISKVQRSLLDYGNVETLRKILAPFSFDSLLDVGCGLGEFSMMLKKPRYVGLDNSMKRVQYASRKYRQHDFVAGDASRLPFRDNSFDVSFFINAAHHFSDQELCLVLLEMRRASSKYLVVVDIVKTENQNRLSSFFYGLDRGKTIRRQNEIKNILSSVEDTRLLERKSYTTFPGFYCHEVFILEIKK